MTVPFLFPMKKHKETQNLSSQDLCVDFQENFVEDKVKFRGLAVASQGTLTHSSAKFAEKTRAIACEDRFLLSVKNKYGNKQTVNSHTFAQRNENQRLGEVLLVLAGGADSRGGGVTYRDTGAYCGHTGG